MRQGKLCCQVWTLELEFFVSCSIFSCHPVLCGSWTLLLWSLSSSCLWIHWLSLDWKGSVGVQSPCEEVVQCRAGTEAVGKWSGHDCCAGTLPWVRGHTSCLAVCSQRTRGTGLTLGWHALSVHQFEDARPWKMPTLFLTGSKVLWWNELWTEVRSPRLCTSENHEASRLDAGKAWLLPLLSPLCASE